MGSVGVWLVARLYVGSVGKSVAWPFVMAAVVVAGDMAKGDVVGATKLGIPDSVDFGSVILVDMSFSAEIVEN